MAEMVVVSEQPEAGDEAPVVADVAAEPVVAEAVTVAEVRYLTAAGKWSSSIWDCHVDPPICCYVTFCYWCAFGSVMSAHFDDKTCASECCSVCLWDTANGCFGPYYHSVKRAQIRKMYGDLPEEPCDDCTTACCLGCCALCQEGRHTKAARPARTGCLGM